jgi:hypothetical protein
MSKEQKLKSVIVILLLIIAYFGINIIRLENYHYAVQVGFCSDISQAERDKCLSSIETRTNPFWHLLYGLKIF